LNKAIKEWRRVLVFANGELVGPSVLPALPAHIVESGQHHAELDRHIDQLNLLLIELIHFDGWRFGGKRMFGNAASVRLIFRPESEAKVLASGRPDPVVTDLGARSPPVLVVGPGDHCAQHFLLFGSFDGNQLHAVGLAEIVGAPPRFLSIEIFIRWLL
jgi:hypothetical protein